LLPLLGAVGACAALAAGCGVVVAAGAMQDQANFCDGTYALCIKAPCAAIPTLDRLGNYVSDHALCVCDVVKGWSMGPGACADRAPVQHNGRTYLISTYSNLDNASHQILSCARADTVWAQCYGAPCVVDEADPGKAACTCPTEQGPMGTLGGDCRQDACNGIWSAATPANIAFANQRFFQYMQQNHPDVPVNPPAASCAAGPPR